MYPLKSYKLLFVTEAEYTVDVAPSSHTDPSSFLVKTRHDVTIALLLSK